MEAKSITCIGCPLGCELLVSIEKDRVIKITGYQCLKGKAYGMEECTNPTRILTTTIPIENGNVRVVSVKADQPVPKHKIINIMEELKGIKTTAPVHSGDVVVKNLLGMGINFIATKNVYQK